MKFIIPCLISFLITVVIMPLVIRLATTCKCLDLPGGRRLHTSITPRWGGVAFFAGVLPFLFIENSNGALTPYIVASCLLVGMGMIDDLKSLGWKTKLAGMTAATSIVIFAGDMTIHQLGTYGSLGRIELGSLSIPFTYLGIIGITNAINLLDGLNGLAGGVSLLGFLFMGIAAVIAGNIMVALICFAFVGALGAYLLFNFPNARVFMGDSGSIFLGFSLALTAVLLTQDAHSSVNSMFPVLVLLIPIVDTLRVLIVRLLNGNNPFKADHLHLHFLITHNNITPKNTTLLFWLVTALCGGIGLAMTDMTSMTYLNVVLSGSLFLSLFAASLTQRRQQRVGDSPEMPQSCSEYPAPAPFYRDSSFAEGRGGMMTFKWMVILGMLLVPAQAIPLETPTGGTGKERILQAESIYLTLKKTCLEDRPLECESIQLKGDQNYECETH